MKTYTLAISPQTHVRSTKGDSLCFRIPDEEQTDAMASRKRRLVRYNDYKIDLAEECRRKGFILQKSGMSITFYVPCPKSWRPGKKKKNHLQPHETKPDVDNFLKALLDIYKKDNRVFWDDKTVWHIASIQKFWVDFSIGWIKIETGHPCRQFEQHSVQDPSQLLIPFDPPPKRTRKKK